MFVRGPARVVAISRLGVTRAHELDASFRRSQPIDPPESAPIAAALRTIGSARVMGLPPGGAH